MANNKVSKGSKGSKGSTAVPPRKEKICRLIKF